MSRLLAALVVCIGCGGPNVTGGEREFTDKPEFSGNPRSASPPKDDDREKAPLFTYKLPKNVKRRDISGIEVVLQADSSRSPEGYYIDVFAVVPAKTKDEKPRHIPLGGQDVFKPLKERETTTVYLSPPAVDAWLKGKSGAELKLGFEVKPANPDRPTPDVMLRITDVKAARRSDRLPQDRR
jgi:hypothetical protein